METEEEIKQLKEILEKTPFKPIESPLSNIFSIHSWKIKSKQKKIEELKLDIQIKKLEKELKEID